MRRSLFALALFLSATALQANAPALPNRPEELPSPAPLKFAPPQIVRETLPNGMRVLMLPDHALPLARLCAIVKAGDLYEPADKLGVAGLTGAALVTGGTVKYPADKLQETLESLAAELETSIGKEYGEVSLDLLEKDLGTGLPIFADVLMHPAFDAGKVAVEKAKIEEELRRQDEEPWGVADREAAKVLYGKDSPWARTPTVKGVEALTREDCAAYHARFFRPGNIILAVSGDFESATMLKCLSSLFQDWPASPAVFPAVATAPVEDRAAVVVMDKSDLTQATVYIGQLSGRRGRGETFNQDRYAMDVLNFIVGGGGFTSILTREIRSNRGLAYTVASDYSFDTDRGTFFAFCQTGLPTVGEACGLMRDTLRGVLEKPPADKDVEVAKKSIVNEFVFNYQSPERIVLQAAIQEFYGYPADFMSSYPERVRRVTADDCLKVARKYIQPDKLTYFVLGPAQKLQEPMKAFGAVEVKPLPQP